MNNNNKNSQDKEREVYAFNLQIPIVIPEAETVELLTENLEPHLKKLVDAEHMTLEEVAAYLQFINYMSGISPFMMDAFLQTYRQIKRQDSGLILPPKGLIV